MKTCFAVSTVFLAGFLKDGVHPNAAGYAIWAEELKKVL